ncbi:hypothetical protein PoB_004165500 [Plakobranchus ocellatus]|uniref:Uncharacterized protein n=1 Tax=Plakobranchus ocellatus TaxID=259542 RepID=A0AAV4B7T4_9GAST|nr:hypothetical protein PoB_004165500 [Plakobranchus ocellatus]
MANQAKHLFAHYNCPTTWRRYFCSENCQTAGWAIGGQRSGRNLAALFSYHGGASYPKSDGSDHTTNSIDPNNNNRRLQEY